MKPHIINTGQDSSDHNELISGLKELERKVLWLATYMIHNANHIRAKKDGLKVGGHQASSASLLSIMTALYFHVLNAEDRVAVKPHASPVFHAIQYLMGNQSLDNLQNFRGFGGAQSYPSRTKDFPQVDFSTGSVGLGVAATLFSSIVQDYVEAHDFDNPHTRGRMVALVGDAELDEGNVYEALLDGWKHKVRDLWWIIDYNRQSLDGVINDDLFKKIEGIFDSLGWNVTTLKYGRKLKAIRPINGGEAILDWITECPNQLYSALTFQGGAAWRKQLLKDIGDTSGVKSILDDHNNDGLHGLMTNLAGHDMESLLHAFDSIDGDPRPQCIIAYTVKGFGLPLAGHKDNHAGLLTPKQLTTFQTKMLVEEGKEWDKFAGLKLPEKQLQNIISNAPQSKRSKINSLSPKYKIPAIETPKGDKMSTQEAFGKIMFELAKTDDDFSNRIVTTSPDVTVSTNLGGWVNKRKLFERDIKEDVFNRKKIPSAQLWDKIPEGQHIELGIAENNLFLLLSQLGLSENFFAERLFPIGTLYDPFINRGLDALNYACYQDSRFMVVATPSGITLAPEGGAHQSIHPPVIGMAQPGLTYFEPTYAHELAAIMEWGFQHMQSEKGGSVYLRLTTRLINQIGSATSSRAITSGAYWLKEPKPDTPLAIIYCGTVAPEALAAWEIGNKSHPGIGLMAVTSPDIIHRDWRAGTMAEINDGQIRPSHIERLLGELSPNAKLVTVIDGAPGTLSWLGSVCGHKTQALGIETFGQCGDIYALYEEYAIGTEAITRACTNIFLP